MATLLGPAPAAAQTRRALLIGIADYTVPTGGAAPVRRVRNLSGPVNDVDAIRGLLVARHGFEPTRIRQVTNGAATRAAILGALDSLAAASQAGDDVVFFYAGHGSQVKNDASREADGLDESLVPADAPLGASDIRDKELRVRFAAIAARGARLTVIVDACHSGSIARGVLLGQTRYADPSTTTISDADTGPAPESMRGVLVLSAAQDIERAQEITPAGRPTVGAFTDALVAALAEAPREESVAAAFLRARARMKALGLAQEPVLSGDIARRGAPLFDAPKSGPRGALTLPVSRVSSDAAEVEGGLAVGLTVGSRLRCGPATALGSTSQGTVSPGITVEGVETTVTAALGLGRSRVRFAAGSRLAPGDVCRVTSLAPDAAAVLRLWVAPPFNAAARAQYDALDSLLKVVPRARRVRDAVATPPSHLVWWTGREWQMRRGDERPRALRMDIAGLRAACTGSGPCDLFVVGALAAEVRTALADALTPLPVTLARDPSSADYLLDADGMRGSWVRAAGGGASVVPPQTSPVVARRPAEAFALADQAAALARVWAWHRLASPASGADAFPYRLAAWQDARSGARVSVGDALRPSTPYRAVFELPTDRVGETGLLQARYVYMFAIDANGNGDLLFPLDAFGAVENRVSAARGVAQSFTVPLAREQWLFETGEAGSRDLIVVLTTEEPLPDASVLTFRGVRTRRAVPAQTSPLSRFLFGVGESTRSDAGGIPATWSLQRVVLEVGH